METLLFWLLAVIALIAAASMIIQRNPVHSALFLIITLLSLAGLFLLLSAHFLAVIQVIVYAGAIMVLFLFVIMLLDIRRIEAAPSRVKLQKSLGILLGVIFLLETLLVLRSGVISDMAAAAPPRLRTLGRPWHLGEPYLPATSFRCNWRRSSSLSL